MSRRSIATPCPTSVTQEALYQKSLDETTTTLNFTTAFDASFRQVKPRRNQRLSVQFAIHEDAEVAPPATQTSLAKPARRLTGSFTNLPVAPNRHDASERPNDPRRASISRLGQAPKRPPTRLSIVPETAMKEPERNQEDDTKMLNLTINSSRPLRRGTIYIPNDETTVPSTYMGIFSPLKAPEQATTQAAESTIDMTALISQIAVKRGNGRRTSILDAAPRRAPLQASSRKSQATSFPLDRPGQGGGKENVPPGLAECEKQMLDLSLVEPTSMSSLRHSPPRVQSRIETKRPRPSIYAPAASTKERMKPRTSLALSSSQLSSHRELRKDGTGGTLVKQPDLINRKQHVPRPNAYHAPEPARMKPRVPSRFVIPSIQHESATSIHTILDDDVANPSLYEENWLGHQEIAITQLVNKLFTAAQPGKLRKGLPLTLAQEVVTIYNTNSNAVLYNRIQAALLYGALSIPQDILDQAEAFTKDVGRKQRFMELWIKTYDRDVLEAALEAVVGRKCRVQGGRSSDTYSPTSSPTKRALYNFIDSFLLRNEDSRPDRTVRNRSAWSYQRTMLRSLMLIKLLDAIKVTGCTAFSSALFLPSSPFKSSLAVLHSLFQMMNSAAGDPMRPLGHINYTVSHVQYPLEEFIYNIENLAVDLRDGIRLTRLIELLLYPSASRDLSKNADIDATTTIIMPAGESVDFQNGQDWPLSQHLKFPCQSRVARLWNVQIALSAAARVKGMETMVDGISAADIVDGFREKTIRLLWALVGKCGLASLIDWDDVRWETRRLMLQTNLSTPSYIDADDLDDTSASRTFESCKGLLKSWIHAVAASQGIQVRNFTTSFADGKVFQAIVDSYEPYLTSSNPHNTSEDQHVHKSPLSTRLASLGCSKQFADLFSTSETAHIFDRDFVLATLAFLCSRLLTPSKNTRAAVVIQTAWRRHWDQVQATRNVQRRKIASECADQVLLMENKKREEDRSNAIQTRPLLPVIQESPVDNNQQRAICSPSSEPSEADIWLSL